MAETKTIAVVGATGAQGGGLVRAILNDPDGGLKARAITRNVDSDKAKALAAQGAEVVAADVDDVESLKRAFDGAYGAYGVTFFWEHFSPVRETAQAEAIALAAKAAGLRHVIWSTLEDTRKWVPLDDDRMPTLMGEYKVPHLDAKGQADHLFVDAGLPVTLLLTSFYWDNFIHFGMGPQKGPDGKLAITFPLDDKKLPGSAAADIGKCAYGIFRGGEEYIGKTVGVASEHLSGSEMAAALSTALGQEIGYNAVPAEVYRGFGFPGAEDLGNMFQFMRDFDDVFRGARDPAIARGLCPDLETFETWLSTNASRIPM